MKLSNVDKIYREYQFLENILPRIKVKDANVKWWNEDVFSMSSVDRPSVGDYDTRFVRKIFLLDERGDTVTRVGESWIPFWTRDENIGQTFARIGYKADRVRYAVCLNRNIETSSITLYKR